MSQWRLIDCNWPAFGAAEPVPWASLDGCRRHLAEARSAMAARGLTHLVVYGDREHFANLVYLIGFDPRFEEALLVLRQDETPLLIVGNECEGYLAVSPLYNVGALRHERFQPFSLLSQPRADSRFIGDILADEGIGPNATVGAVGWKYFADSEHPDGLHALDLPAYLADTLRELAGRENVVNATDIMMNPQDGLRAICSAPEIAYFEFTSTLASSGMRRMLYGLREGMVDFELAALSGYPGVPFGCHTTVVSGANWDYGLSSPIGATIRRGDPLATNVCYWGSNVCRAGWVAETAADLPDQAQDYLAAFAGPYFVAMSQWFELLRIGTSGGALARLIAEALPHDRFGILLNPGHLIHLDEWVSSPIYAGSQIPLRSGMVMQVDVIPSSPVYGSTRMEDGVVLADEALQAALAADYADCYRRCLARRQFMRETLGIAVPDDVLPLSDMPAIVPPFFLAPQRILAMA